MYKNTDRHTNRSTHVLFRGNLWGILFIFEQPFGAASLWVGQAGKIWVFNSNPPGYFYVLRLTIFFSGEFWSVKATSQSGRTRLLSMTGLSEYFLIFRALIFMMSISANWGIIHSTLENKLSSTCFQHFLWGKHIIRLNWIGSNFFYNKHCEVLVSCSDWVDWIDFIELHACNMLSKTVKSTACQL